MGVMQEAPVSDTDTSRTAMTRTIPPSLSPILTDLELDAPQVVTLAELATPARVATEPKTVADRLRKLGWLLPTGTAGVWEFAPAAHACLLYTSDAADEEDSVDLGGRRI